MSTLSNAERVVLEAVAEAWCEHGRGVTAAEIADAGLTSSRSTARFLLGQLARRGLVEQHRDCWWLSQRGLRVLSGGGLPLS